MSQTPHDQFAKQVLEGLLEPFGQVSLNRPIVSEPRAADVWFVPHLVPENAATFQALGILGQMAQTSCLLEPFRNAIQAEDILKSVGKLADIRTELGRKARREKLSLSTSQLPRLWILTPTASKQLLAELVVGDPTLWTTGFYFVSKPLMTGIVVIHQLPVVEATLWLRLMGRGDVQSGAIAELINLPRTHPFKLHALECLAVLRINLELRQNLKGDRTLNRNQQELAMNLSPAYQEWRRLTLQEGHQAEILGLLEAKFGVLDEALERLVEPLMQLSTVERSRLILQSSREALLAWLEQQSS